MLLIKKVLTGHVDRFVRLNTDAMATCDEAENPEPRAVD
jgi:hypothetical protein